MVCSGAGAILLFSGGQGGGCRGCGRKLIRERISDGQKTVDGHYDLDARAFMSDPSRPKPYAPHGTLDGKITDSTLARRMSLWARWGNSSGMAFDAEKFLDKHIQYNDLRGHLRDRPSQPWTPF